MLDRLAALIKSFFNNMMGKMETPELLLEKAHDDLQTSVTQTRQGLVQSMTTEKTLEGQIKKNQEEIEKWQRNAALAVQQGNEDVARQCLQKKQEAAQALSSMESQLASQKQATAALKQRLSELEGEFQKFQANKQNLLAREKAASASARATELLPGASGAPISKMDQLEQKIMEKEAKSAALRELSMSDSKPTQDLLAQMDIESELAALKGASPGAKEPLKIVAVDAEIVDEDADGK